MRIAVTGTHGVGKTTFIDDFAAAYPGFESVAEPYWLFDQQGLPFSDGATIVDLEKQLTESCKLIVGCAGGGDVIFDRCPLDFLAHLEVVSASEGFEWLPSGRELAQVSKAIAMLDVLFFVPVASPDEIPVQNRTPSTAQPHGPTAQEHAPRRRSGTIAQRTAHSGSRGFPDTTRGDCRLPSWSLLGTRDVRFSSFRAMQAARKHTLSGRFQRPRQPNYRNGARSGRSTTLPIGRYCLLVGFPRKCASADFRESRSRA